MSEEITLSTRYLNLAARAWGPVDALPVLALHGWLDNAASFERLAPLISGARLVALDLPGHGLSEHRPAGMHYHFIDFIQDIVAAADALNWEQFALLGHSLGAGIASFVAAAIPERITQLALIEGLGPLSGNPSEGPAQLAKSMIQMNQWERKSLPVYANLDEAARARHKLTGLSQEAAAIIASRGTKPVGSGLGWRSDPRLTLKSPIYLTEEQVLAFLTGIQAPTFLVRGESGYLLKREFMAKRYRQVADLTVKVLTGGHHLHLENPEPVASVLNDFFKT